MRSERSDERLERHASAIGRRQGIYRRNGSGEREYDTTFVVIDPEKPFWIPSRSYPGDAGYDLYASEPVVIPAGEFMDVPTNVRIALPAAVWGRITGRSSTLRNRAILATEGIIDSGYRGELKMGAFNLGHTTQVIREGDRIAQLILQDVVAAHWTQAEELPSSARSDRGFGSTGE